MTRKAVLYPTTRVAPSDIHQHLERGAAAVILAGKQNPTSYYPRGYYMIYVYLPNKADADVLHQKYGWREPYQNYCGIGPNVYYTSPRVAQSVIQADPEDQMRRLYDNLCAIGIKVEEADSEGQK